MKRTLCAVGLAALCVAWVAPGAAQPVPDHLKCYKISDPQAKATYTAELDGLTAEPGCVIKVPAKLACVPATKTNVTPPPPGGGGTGTPNSFFCYKVKCPKATLPTLTGADQFGSRTVSPKTVKLLCAPLAGPLTTTTTTSTSTTTTTTTMPRFADNGDGTVTDHQTGLIWEQKVAGSGCPHCVNDSYIWSSSGSAPDGTAFTSFLNTLNGGATGVGSCTSSDGTAVTTAGFAGHCDWRLPTIQELNTILNCTFFACVDPAVFGPTQAGFYWSSLTFAGNPVKAWFMFMSAGSPGINDKTNVNFVRAVRGGS